MADHGARDHATWSASATARNWNCPGALTLAARVAGPEKESEAAAWGTACHQIAEKCLRSGKDAAEFIDTVEKTKQREFVVDEEMADTAQQFIDYVRTRQEEGWAGVECPRCKGSGLAYSEALDIDAACPNCGGTGEAYSHASLQIEQHFTLESLKPPFDAGGTADAVLYYAHAKMLEVVDLKGGRGVVVEAKGNPQLRTYALGAMLANPGLDVERVTVTIVQPRAPHKDGRIRSETFHVADLVEWTADLLKAMKRSFLAQSEEFVIGKPDSKHPSEAAWAAEYLRAGDHCKFCPAAGFCPALEQRALDAAGIWFDDLDQPRLANTPDSLAPEEIAKKLDMFDMIQEWMNAVRAYAHTQAEMGVAIPGYQLADKIGNRAWKDGEAAIATLAEKTGEGREFFLAEPKPLSPTQAEKKLGTKRKHLLADLVERPIRGTNLVASARSTRPAATPAAQKFFSPITD